MLGFIGWLIVGGGSFTVPYIVRGMDVRGSTYYLARGDGGIRVLRKGEEILRYDQDLPALDVAVVGDRVFVAGGAEGVYVLVQSEEGFALEHAHTPGCLVWGVDARGIGRDRYHVWVGCGSQVLFYRVSVDGMKLEKQWDTGEIVKDVCAADDMLYVITSRDLLVLDADGTRTLTSVSLVRMGTPERLSCRRQGTPRYVAVALDRGGIAVMEITRPVRAARPTVLTVPGRVRAVSLAVNDSVRIVYASQWRRITRIGVRTYPPPPESVRVTGRVVDHRGMGIEGAIVLTGPEGLLTPVGAKTDGLGRFRLLLSPGTYRFDVHLWGWDTTWIPAKRIEGRHIHLGSLEVLRMEPFETLLRRGIAAYRAGDYRKALGFLEEALRMFPEHPEALQWYTQAKQHVPDAVRQSPLSDTVAPVQPHGVPESTRAPISARPSKSPPSSSTLSPLSAPSERTDTLPLFLISGVLVFLILWVTWLVHVVRTSGVASGRLDIPSGDTAAYRGQHAPPGASNLHVQVMVPLSKGMYRRIDREIPAIDEAFTLLQNLPEGSEIAWLVDGAEETIEVYVNTHLVSQRTVVIREPRWQREQGEMSG